MPNKPRSVSPAYPITSGLLVAEAIEAGDELGQILGSPGFDNSRNHLGFCRFTKLAVVIQEVLFRERGAV